MAAAADCKKICEHVKNLGISLGEKMGEGGEPQFDDVVVAFNGVDKEGYESFDIRREWNGRSGEDEDGLFFAFCKTAHKPYDLAVQCCLIVFRHYFGKKFVVSSDGDEDAWSQACALCQAVLGLTTAGFTLRK